MVKDGTMARAISVLFLLVGRGGSKGVPGKNLRHINGASLISYRAVSARKSKYCDRLIVSSDSADIREEARRWGAEVLFSRPDELATDQATSDDVVLHAMDWVERNEGRSYDAVMLLEPSSPFARADHYDAAVELFVQREADLVVGVRETDIASVFVGPMSENGSIAPIVSRLIERRQLRRQDQPREVTMNGALYLIRWSTLKEARRIYSNPAGTYGLLMDRLHSVEIETLEDLAYANHVIEQGLIDRSPWQ
jgi:CMP-N,N'-diacetyllegionaminic acid synthase